MRLRLVPEERRFYELFRQDIAVCREGVTALVTMLHDFREAKEHARRVNILERQGDQRHRRDLRAAESYLYHAVRA